MNKKKVNKDSQCNIRFEHEFLAEIIDTAERKGYSRTEYIRRACRTQLDLDNGAGDKELVRFLRSLIDDKTPSYGVAEQNRPSYMKAEKDRVGREEVLQAAADLFNYLLKEGKISLK